MYVYLVRHGQSVFNAERRIQGQLDPALSELGLAQARAAASALQQFPLEAIFASPLSRALETARAIAEPCGLPVQTDDRLKEIHAGVFQGKCWPEIEAGMPEFARRWKAMEPDFVIPTGESRRQLMVRGREFFASLRERPWQHVAVVAHGGLLGAALKALLEVPAHLNPFELLNGAITRLQWDTRLRLLTLNESEHLREINRDQKIHYGDL